MTMVAAPMNLVLERKTNKLDPSSYGATVGGTAIIAIGAYSPYLQPTLFADPSQGGTFIGAQLHINIETPPVLLQAIYQFPKTGSSESATLHSRVERYLRSRDINKTPKQWQWDLMESLHDELDSLYPNAIYITGGDLNHHRWGEYDHPCTKYYLDTLQYDNMPFEVENDPLFASEDDSDEPSPLTAPITTYTYGSTSDNPKWIDHVLFKGPHVNYHTHYVSPTHTINGLSDHLAFVAGFRLHDHQVKQPRGEEDRRSVLLQANDLNKSFQIASHNEKLVQLYEEHLESIEIPLSANLKTLADHALNIQTLQESIYKAARNAHKDLHPGNRKLRDGWSPESQLLDNYYTLLTATYQIVNRYGIPAARQQLKSFHRKHRLRQHTVRGELLYRYREHIETHITSHTNPRLFLSLTDSALPLNNNQYKEIITQERKRIQKLNHAKQRKERRIRISEYCRKQEVAREQGKIRAVLQSQLERPYHQGFTHIRDKDGHLIVNTHDAHNAVTDHFEHHHFNRRNTWYDQTGINDDTPHGALLREALLQGTWRTHEHDFLSSLPPEDREDASLFLDECRMKVSPEAQAQLQTAMQAPITYEDFTQELFSHKDNTSGGPSGVTYSMLRHAGESILRSLYRSLEYFWDKKIPPPDWQERIMALIPKVEHQPRMDQLRPIMLLECCRKVWLAIIADRIEYVLTSYDVWDASQKGGLPRHGTEDAILAIVNAIEDARNHQQELHVIGFDKAKAFDSPGRYITELAWRRLGVPADVARFITRCDSNNKIYPKTPFFMHQKRGARWFHALFGVPQGDSLACKSYLAIEDILLSLLRKRKEIRYYRITDINRTLHTQFVEQYVDDTIGLLRDEESTQRLVNILQKAAIVLNIHINPKKTRLMSLMWDNNTLIKAPSPEVFALGSDGAPQLIPSSHIDTPIRILGAFLNASNSPSQIIQELTKKARQIANMLGRKKGSPDTIKTILNSTIYPQLGYVLSFTAATNSQLDKVAAPFRKLVRNKLHVKKIPNVILFGQQATNYSMDFTDLTDYVNEMKDSRRIRLMAGTPHTRRLVTCLFDRVACQADTDQNSTITWTKCAHLPARRLAGTPSGVGWAHSLIQLVQSIPDAEIALRYLPHNINLQKASQVLGTPITQTFLTPLLQPEVDHLSPQAWEDIQEQYQLYYVEELFEYHAELPTEEAVAAHTGHINRMMNTIHTEAHPFLTRIINEYASRTDISHGVITARPEIFFYTEETDHTNREGPLTSALDLPNQGRVDPHTKRPTKRKDIYELGRFNADSNPPVVEHRRWFKGPDTSIRNKDKVKTFYLSSKQYREGMSDTKLTVRLGSQKIHITRCQSGPLNQGGRQHQYLYTPLRQLMYVPDQQDLLLHSHKTPLRFHFPPAFEACWQRMVAAREPVKLFTDGSFTPHFQAEDSFLLHPEKPSTVVTTVVLRETTPTPATHILRVNTLQADYTIYRAELLGAAIVANLAWSLPRSTLVTDCKGIHDQINSHKNSFFRQRLDTGQSLTHIIDKKRQGSESGFLWEYIIRACKHFNSQWQKAHTDEYVNENQIGNAIADYAARHLDERAQHLWNNVLAETGTQHHNLTFHDIDLSDFLQRKETETLYEIRIGGRAYNDSPKSLLKHAIAQRQRQYFEGRADSFFMHIRDWSSLFTWNLTGSALMTCKMQYTQTASTRLPPKRFGFKILHDDFMNLSFKWKIEFSRKVRQNTDELISEDDLRADFPPPLCPLCSQQQDSMTHTLCNCREVGLQHLRVRMHKALHRLTHDIQHSAKTDTLIALLVLHRQELHASESADSNLDSRIYGGLLSRQQLEHYMHSARATAEQVRQALKLIIPITISYAYEMWRYYLDAAHKADSALARYEQKFLDENHTMDAGPASDPISSHSHNHQVMPADAHQQQRQHNITTQPRINTLHGIEIGHHITGKTRNTTAARRAAVKCKDIRELFAHQTKQSMPFSSNLSLQQLSTQVAKAAAPLQNIAPVPLPPSEANDTSRKRGAILIPHAPHHQDKNASVEQFSTVKRPRLQRRAEATSPLQSPRSSHLENSYAALETDDEDGRSDHDRDATHLQTSPTSPRNYTPLASNGIESQAPTGNPASIYLSREARIRANKRAAIQIQRRLQLTRARQLELDDQKAAELTDALRSRLPSEESRSRIKVNFRRLCTFATKRFHRHKQTRPEPIVEGDSPQVNIPEPTHDDDTIPLILPDGTPYVFYHKFADIVCRDTSRDAPEQYILTRLLPRTGYLVQVLPDGNCLYHATYETLNAQHISDDNFHEIRQNSVEYLVTNLRNTIDLVPQAWSGPPERYFQRFLPQVSSTPEFGEESSLHAISSVYNVNIDVFSYSWSAPDRSWEFIKARFVPPRSSTASITLICDTSGLHYQAVVDAAPVPHIPAALTQTVLNRLYHTAATNRSPGGSTPRLIKSTSQCHCIASGRGNTCFDNTCSNRLFSRFCETCSQLCFNRLEHFRPYPVSVRPQPRLGAQDYGLFSDTPISEGHLIIEYTGEIYLRQHYLQLLRKRPHAYRHSVSFLRRNAVEYLITADKYGSRARFANHSCAPNCALTLMQCPEGYKLFLKATRRIDRHEELTIDYQWEPRTSKKEQLPLTPCLCGHALCRGTIESVASPPHMPALPSLAPVPSHASTASRSPEPAAQSRTNEPTSTIIHGEMAPPARSVGRSTPSHSPRGGIDGARTPAERTNGRASDSGEYEQRVYPAHCAVRSDDTTHIEERREGADLRRLPASGRAEESENTSIGDTHGEGTKRSDSRLGAGKRGEKSSIDGGIRGEISRKRVHYDTSEDPVDEHEEQRDTSRTEDPITSEGANEKVTDEIETIVEGSTRRSRGGSSIESRRGEKQCTPRRDTKIRNERVKECYEGASEDAEDTDEERGATTKKKTPTVNRTARGRTTTENAANSEVATKSFSSYIERRRGKQLIENADTKVQEETTLRNDINVGAYSEIPNEERRDTTTKKKKFIRTTRSSNSASKRRREDKQHTKSTDTKAREETSWRGEDEAAECLNDPDRERVDISTKKTPPENRVTRRRADKESDTALGGDPRESADANDTRRGNLTRRNEKTLLRTRGTTAHEITTGARANTATLLDWKGKKKRQSRDRDITARPAHVTENRGYTRGDEGRMIIRNDDTALKKRSADAANFITTRLERPPKKSATEPVKRILITDFFHRQKTIPGHGAPPGPKVGVKRRRSDDDRGPSLKLQRVREPD
jgi:hypothetical protein